MEVVTKKNVLKEISNMLKEITCYDIGDLLPKKENVSYGIKRDNTRIFFDNKSELNRYVSDNNLDKTTIFKVVYVGKIHEYDNVIKVIRNDRVDMYSIVDEHTYFKHNKEKSLEFNSCMWEFKYGNISDYYRAFDKKEENNVLIYR